MAKRNKPFASWRLLAQSGSRHFHIETRNGKTWAKRGLVPAVLRETGYLAETRDVPSSQAAEFDELVLRGIDFHADVMTDRNLWFRAGPASFNLVIRGGKVRLYLQDGVLDPETREFAEEKS